MVAIPSRFGPFAHNDVTTMDVLLGKYTVFGDEQAGLLVGYVSLFSWISHIANWCSRMPNHPI